MEKDIKDFINTTDEADRFIREIENERMKKTAEKLDEEILRILKGDKK